MGEPMDAATRAAVKRSIREADQRFVELKRNQTPSPLQEWEVRAFERAELTSLRSKVMELEDQAKKQRARVAQLTRTISRLRVREKEAASKNASLAKQVGAFKREAELRPKRSRIRIPVKSSFVIGGKR